MKTEIKKNYWVKEKVKGCYIVGVRMKDQQIDVTNDTNKAKIYRDDKVSKVLLLLELVSTNTKWQIIDTGSPIELHYTDDIEEYKRLVVQGILDKFSDKEKSGVHAVTPKYILDMISSRKDEDGAEELPHGTLIPTSWSDCYQEHTWIEDAVEQMAPGCKALYYGHMSVL